MLFQNDKANFHSQWLRMLTKLIQIDQEPLEPQRIITQIWVDLALAKEMEEER